MTLSSFGRADHTKICIVMESLARAVHHFLLASFLNLTGMIGRLLWHLAMFLEECKQREEHGRSWEKKEQISPRFLLKIAFIDKNAIRCLHLPA